MLIKVKVFCGVKKEAIEKNKDYFIVKVREKAEQNKANKRVIEILSLFFNSRVKIVKGHKSPHKIFEVCQK